MPLAGNPASLASADSAGFLPEIPDKLDFINFNLLSPYTVQKMWRGREILKELQTLSGMNTEVYGYNNCKIRNSSLVHGRLAPGKMYDSDWFSIRYENGNSLVSAWLVCRPITSENAPIFDGQSR